MSLQSHQLSLTEEEVKQKSGLGLASAPQPCWPLCWSLNMSKSFPPAGLCLCCSLFPSRDHQSHNFPWAAPFHHAGLSSAATSSVGPALMIPAESPLPPVIVLILHLLCHQSIGCGLK